MNLNYICRCNNVEVVNMLRVRRSSFSAFVEMFRESELLKYSIHTSVE